MQNAIKLENISNLITSPSSYQCSKTRLVHFVITLIYYECDIEFLYKLHNIINLKSTNFEFKIF
jgi:hypothetical protein